MISMTQIQIKRPNLIALYTSQQEVCSVEVEALAPVFKKSIRDQTKLT